MEYYDYNSNRKKNTDFDVATNYILIGSNRYFGMNPKVEPYAGLQLGMGIFNVENPDNGNSGNSTKFVWGAKIGANIWASEKVGIKIQAGLNSAVQSAGGGCILELAASEQVLALIPLFTSFMLVEDLLLI